MIDQVIFAKNRPDLVAATKALDRVLLWNHYVVPQWNYGKVRSARWDRFGHPAPLPKYGRVGISHRLVVGRRKSGQDGKPVLMLVRSGAGMCAISACGRGLDRRLNRHGWVRGCGPGPSPILVVETPRALFRKGRGRNADAPLSYELPDTPTSCC